MNKHLTSDMRAYSRSKCSLADETKKMDLNSFEYRYSAQVVLATILVCGDLSGALQKLNEGAEPHKVRPCNAERVAYCDNDFKNGTSQVGFLPSYHDATEPRHAELSHPGPWAFCRYLALLISRLFFCKNTILFRYTITHVPERMEPLLAFPNGITFRTRRT